MNWTRDRIGVAKGIVAALGLALGAVCVYALVLSFVALVLPNAPESWHVVSLLILALWLGEFLRRRVAPKR